MDRLPSDFWLVSGLAQKYEFERQIASTAMSLVVSARHIDLDIRVAIKLLAPQAQGSRIAVSRFRREARTAAKIKSQHVVRIIDVSSTSSGAPYFVMEYLDGRDLKEVLERFPKRQAPYADTIDFILQASDAVCEGHTLGIVHRDLKPANLFHVERGNACPIIKVLDFGISKVAPSPGETDRTDRHEILGTPSYMSPEQIDASANVDHRTDIWSLGVILYEAIAGRPPFSGGSTAELWNRVRYESPEPLPSLRSDCPKELWQITSKCLQKNPEDRYPSLGELALALSRLAQELRWTGMERIPFDVPPASACESTVNVPRAVASQRRGAGTKVRILKFGFWGFAGTGLLAAAMFFDANMAAQSAAASHPIACGEASMSPLSSQVNEPFEGKPIASSALPDMTREERPLTGSRKLRHIRKAGKPPVAPQIQPAPSEDTSTDSQVHRRTLVGPRFIINPITTRK